MCTWKYSMHICIHVCVLNKMNDTLKGLKGTDLSYGWVLQCHSKEKVDSASSKVFSYSKMPRSQMSAVWYFNLGTITLLKAREESVIFWKRMDWGQIQPLKIPKWHSSNWCKLNMVVQFNTMSTVQFMHCFYSEWNKSWICSRPTILNQK